MGAKAIIEEKRKVKIKEPKKYKVVMYLSLIHIYI